jgi:hypothetical protein
LADALAESLRKGGPDGRYRLIDIQANQGLRVLCVAGFMMAHRIRLRCAGSPFNAHEALQRHDKLWFDKSGPRKRFLLLNHS